MLRFFTPGAAAPPLAEADVDATYKRLRLATIVTLTLTYGFFYTCRLGLSVVKKPLIDGGIFDATALGWIGAGFFWGYAAGKLINGFLADRANLRVFIPFGLMVSAVINLAMGANTIVVVAVALWAFNGWFQGFGAPASVVMITRWFGAREQGTMYGIWSTAHSIGEGLTFTATAALVAATAWQAAFIGPGALCLAVATAAYLILRDRPSAVGLPPIERWLMKRDVGGEPDAAAVEAVEQTAKKTSIGRSQLAVLALPAVWIIGLASASMYVSRYAVNSWGILYLQEHHGLSLTEAGGLLGVNTIAGIGGCAVYGYVSDRWFKSRRPPLTLIFGLVEIAGLALILYGPVGNRLTLTIGLITYGFTLSGLLAVLGGLFAVDLVPRAAVGAAMGFIGVFSYIGAGTQEAVSGALIERGTTMIGEVRHYDFGEAAAFWLGASVVSAVLAATLWRVKPTKSDGG